MFQAKPTLSAILMVVTLVIGEEISEEGTLAMEEFLVLVEVMVVIVLGRQLDFLHQEWVQEGSPRGSKQE